MPKCNSCKNPVSVSSIHCEWCGAKIVHEENNIQSNGSVNSNSSLLEFMNKLNDIENEIIKESSSAGTWGALDGVLTRAFGNSKIDSLNYKKITIIQTYPLPKTPDDLLEIANMAVSNFKNTKIHNVALSENSRNENKINKPIKDAWKSKAEQALGILSIYSKTDDFIRQQIDHLIPQLTEEKKGWFK